MTMLLKIEELTVTIDEDTFFNKLGERIAYLRKDRGLSQRKLAELLGLSQQIVASYETGDRHIPVWRLISLAEVLGIDVEKLLNGAQQSKGKPGPAPKVQGLVERVNRLPKTRQRFVMEMIEDALARAH